jgi:hypothetical protein
MDDTAFHREQMAHFTRLAERIKALSAAPGGESLGAIAAAFDDLAGHPGRIMDEGPALVARLMTTTPQAAEFIPRDMLWYLGGDCLHFMPDEEIDHYTRLDEARRAAEERGEPFDWGSARRAGSGLH